MNQVIHFYLILNLLNIKNNITENTYNVDLTIIGNGGNLIPNHKYDTNKVGKN